MPRFCMRDANDKNSEDLNVPEDSISGHDDGTNNYYTGTEPFLAPFTQTQVVLSGIRLVHDGKITQQVTDLGAQIENIRRTFIHTGDANFALQEITRVTTMFAQRVQAWESEASRRERAKSQMSGANMAKMKSELAAVRTKIRLGQRSLTKLEIELHQIIGQEVVEGSERTEEPTQTLDTDIAPSEPEVTLDPELVKQSADALNHSLLMLLQANQSSIWSLGHSGPRLSVVLEDATLPVANEESKTEQVWNATTSPLSILMAVGWNVKTPSEDQPDFQTARKKIDLSFWLIPKSEAASNAMKYADKEIKLTCHGRQIDGSRVTFRSSIESELPQSEVLTRFLGRYRGKYKSEPSVLVGKLRNLEWTQRALLVSLLTADDESK